VDYATRTQTLTLSQGFDDLEIVLRENQKNMKIMVSDAGSADLQSEVDPVAATCKALERAFAAEALFLGNLIDSGVNGVTSPKGNFSTLALPHRPMLLN